MRTAHLGLVAGVLAMLAGPATAGQPINQVGKDTTPARLSTNRCMDAQGRPADASACASGACVDAQGKPVADPSVCDAPQPAEGGKATKSRSNIQNN
jgi:hypothetical protein